MKIIKKFLIFSLTVLIIFSLVSCHKDTTKLGKVVDISDIDTIEVSYSRFDAVAYILDGSFKDVFFTITLCNKQVTDDETRISDLKETIGTGEEIIWIILDKNEGNDAVIFMSKATGEFLVVEIIVDESTSNKTYEYIYASVEGESISIDLLKYFCH